MGAQKGFSTNLSEYPLGKKLISEYVAPAISIPYFYDS
jgi:hypothetical protein